MGMPPLSTLYSSFIVVDPSLTQDMVQTNLAKVGYLHTTPLMLDMYMLAWPVPHHHLSSSRREPLSATIFIYGKLEICNDKILMLR